MEAEQGAEELESLNHNRVGDVFDFPGGALNNQLSELNPPFLQIKDPNTILTAVLGLGFIDAG
ncbi:hypothetical protein IGI04_030537 [Brassica rapa subsp. trilocularis]|nr:hypothetical protein IGI04_030537 [Brassica rapa subsp. trilocularis]